MNFKLLAFFCLVCVIKASIQTSDLKCKSDSSVLCLLNNGTQACCPVSGGTCCESGDFCCPKGFFKKIVIE